MRPSVRLRLLHGLDPDPPTECLLWAGAQTGSGYGHMWADGHYRLTHRLAYELFVGPIPDGMELDHLCRRPLCANPAHLEPVTHRENVRRGNVPLVAGAVQRNRTHCLAGHAYDEANTYRRPTGGRGCRACNREAVARAKVRRLARDRIAAREGAA